MKPLRVEVITPTVQRMGLCNTCELFLDEAGVGKDPIQEALAEYPPEWQEEYRRLSDWIYELAARYDDRVLIKVIDPQSPEGLFKSLRHRVRRYPTWIVDGKTRIAGWDRAALAGALEAALQGEKSDF